jgi:hypothetical protein
VPLLVAAGAAAGLPWAQRHAEAATARRAHAEVLYLWNGGQVRRWAAGFESLAADLYWLRTVQYFGAEKLFASEKKFDLLYPLIEITTTLDPRMEIAYRYGAVFLAERFPIGAGRPDLAVQLLQQGAAANPGSWRLRQELGFFHFVYLHDATRAAQILVEASQMPGAAFWLRNLAAEILVKGGQREISRRMWQEMYEQSEGAMKENARVHLMVLDAASTADALTARAQEFQARHGRAPASLAELEAAGYVRGPLVDPAGIPFEYDVGTGRVAVSRRSYLRRDDLVGGESR